MSHSRNYDELTDNARNMFLCMTNDGDFYRAKIKPACQRIAFKSLEQQQKAFDYLAFQFIPIFEKKYDGVYPTQGEKNMVANACLDNYTEYIVELAGGVR